MLKKAIFATRLKQDGKHVMKQQNEATTRALEAAEKIAEQYLELDIENINVKRIRKVLNEALRVVVQCEQVLGNNHPDTLELYHNIGSMYHDMKNYSRSVEWYSKAAENGNKLAYRDLAWCFYMNKEYEKALTWAEKAVKEYPEDHLGIYDLASIYQTLGRKEEALKMFELCLNIREKQQVSDALISDTKEKIWKLKYGRFSIIKYLSKLFDLNGIICLILVAGLAYYHTQNWTETFNIVFRFSVSFLAYMALCNFIFDFTIRLEEAKFKFWKIPRKVWIKLLLVNLGAWGTFFILLSSYAFTFVCISIPMISMIALIPSFREYRSIK